MIFVWDNVWRHFCVYWLHKANRFMIVLCNLVLLMYKWNSMLKMIKDSRHNWRKMVQALTYVENGLVFISQNCILHKQNLHQWENPKQKIVCLSIKVHRNNEKCDISERIVEGPPIFWCNSGFHLVPRTNGKAPTHKLYGIAREIYFDGEKRGEVPFALNFSA